MTCNGEVVPARPAGPGGRLVGGVRYKAWNPPFSLHPTIPVSSPLVLDLIDTWTGRSMGGCRYHVTHPGGRSYDTFPVNANEAAGRRGNRFWEFGHTPGATDSLRPDPLGQSTTAQPTAGQPTAGQPTAGRAAGGVVPDGGQHGSTFQPLGSSSAPRSRGTRPPVSRAKGYTLDLRRST